MLNEAEAWIVIADTMEATKLRGVRYNGKLVAGRGVVILVFWLWVDGLISFHQSGCMIDRLARVEGREKRLYQAATLREHTMLARLFAEKARRLL